MVIFNIEKAEDVKYLQEALENDPFGKSGAGAPLRDSECHLLAERGNVFDRVPFYLYYDSPNQQHKIQDHTPELEKADLGKFKVKNNVQVTNQKQYNIWLKSLTMELDSMLGMIRRKYPEISKVLIILLK